MEYRRLGKSGLQVSALSFGAWVTFSNQLDTQTGYECMVTAYDAGVNFFDNAEGYANGAAEVIMGEIIKKAGWRRNSFAVSSKVFFGIDERKPMQKGLSRKHVVEACHDALRRLQVDYLDLYYCHRFDPEVPIEEVVWTMTNLIEQGKVLYWGTSEWSAQQIMEAYSVARQYNLIPPTMEQPQYNMFHRQRVEVEYARLYQEIGMGTTIWSPLASGLLTGKYNDGIPEDSRMNVQGYEWLRENIFGSSDIDAKLTQIRQLADVAGDLSTNLPCLSLAWCLKNPNVSSVIMGASRASQIENNVGAIEVLPKLTDEVMTRIEDILANKPA